MGTVFPDDFIIVNGEWRRVEEILTDYEVPVIVVEPEGEPVAADVMAQFTDQA